MARYELDSLRLDASGKRLDENLIRSVIDTSWERTIEGASTLTFTLDDPEGELIDSTLLTAWAWGRGDLGEDKWITKGRRIDVRVGSEVYRLVRVVPSGTQVTFTLEDRDVARLRERFGARKMKREDVTRAEFGRRLIAEVKHPSVPVYCPELHVRQPVEKKKKTAKERTDGAHRGIDPSTPGLTVKGDKATPAQIRCAEELLDAAYEYDNPPRLAIVALMCAATHESAMGTLGMTPATSEDGDSVGVLQARMSYVSVKDAESIPYNVERFMVEPWTGTSLGGAIKQARSGRSIAEITTSIQGNSTGDVYTQWKSEALKWIEAYDGGGGRADGSRTVTKPYQYERKPDEDTWDCLGRVFEEVNWRRFMRRGTTWLLSEETLFAQRPVARLAPGRSGVDYIDFELDMFARDQIQTATVTARAGTQQLQPGQLVVVERRGPANGRWLVASESGKFGDDAVQVTLKKPTRAKPEPLAETESVSGGSDSSALAPAKLGDSTVSGHSELKPGIAEVVNAILDRFPGLEITSTTGGTHAANSLHYAGRAVDLASGDYSLMNKAAAWINTSGLWKQLAEGIHNPGSSGGDALLSVDGGSRVPPSFWGSETWAGHTNHIHIAV